MYRDILDFSLYTVLAFVIGGNQDPRMKQLVLSMIRTHLNNYDELVDIKINLIDNPTDDIQHKRASDPDSGGSSEDSIADAE